MTSAMRDRDRPARVGSPPAHPAGASRDLFTWMAVTAVATISLLEACVTGPGLGQQPGEQAIWARDLLTHVEILASPGMEGRAAGSDGAKNAAEHIAGEFRKIGLRPGGTGDSYLQPFDLVTEIRLGGDNRLESANQGATPESRAYRPWSEFIPIGFSEEGDVETEIAFLGYGITAPELGYDDYAGIDVTGKAVLIMTHEPRERDQHGPFRAAEAFHYTTNRYKAINARQHGAMAVLLVTDPNNHSGEQDAVLSLQGAPSSSSGIVAVSIVREVAETLLSSSGKTLSRLQEEIDRQLVPKSFLAQGVKIKAKVSLVRARGTTANVVGLLPGRDPVLKEEAVVIGAHYDHLGLGGENSLAPAASNVVHPGADDNASGTSALMALARAFQFAGGAKRALIFAAFSGEEIGLLGSYHFVKQPPIPIERTVAMINLDSVGRMDKHRLYIQGVGSGEGLREIIQEASRGLGLDLTLRDDGFGPSDHTPFYAKERPVLHFFTGPHLDYHRPSDTIDKINAEGLRKVTIIAYRTVAMIADGATPIAYRRTKGTPPSERGGERGAGYGPYFGSIPDFSESAVPGVRLGGVRPGSPAERAGLQAGDVIVNFAGVAVKNLPDLTFALRTRRPGDRVEITFFRGGKEHRAQATLEQRR
ncbi:MAG: M28 family peptidase [Candidatus Methylomirabilis oxyfera]|nr:M28 family peptidase [Candidatus Methylomirabilis oxyfera]